jgi:hypothetical protein
MRIKIIIHLLLIVGLSGLNTGKLHAQNDYNQQWPSFRGPGACGYMISSITPVTWDVERLKNIKWKTLVPGLAHSCPVIWGNYLFVTTAATNKSDESLKLGLYGDALFVIILKQSLLIAHFETSTLGITTGF